MSILQFQFKWPKLIFRNNKHLGFLIVSKFNGPFSTLFHILCLLIFFYPEQFFEMDIHNFRPRRKYSGITSIKTKVKISLPS